MNYVTTNIRFPEDVYLALKEEAAKKRASLSAIVREKVGGQGKARRNASQLGRLLDETASQLGRKLRGFDSVSAIRQMREEQ